MVLPERQPGGWSARGQPCDAIHSALRKQMNTYSETCLGYRTGLLQQATSSPLLMSNGNLYLSLSHEDSILSCIYGWQKISKKKDLLRWGGQTRLKSKTYAGLNSNFMMICIYNYIYIYTCIILKGFLYIYIYNPGTAYVSNKKQQQLDSTNAYFAAPRCEGGHGCQEGWLRTRKCRRCTPQPRLRQSWSPR